MICLLEEQPIQLWKSASKQKLIAKKQAALEESKYNRYVTPPGHCSKTCLDTEGGTKITTDSTKLKLIMFPCPIINSQGVLEPAINTYHYGLVLPTSMIREIGKSSKINFVSKAGYHPVIMNTSTPGSGNRINTAYAIPINLKKYFSGTSIPNQSETNILPNLICSIEDGALVKECGEEIDIPLDREDFFEFCRHNGLRTTSEVISKSRSTGSLQDLIIYALKFNGGERQFISYHKGLDDEGRYGEGSWTNKPNGPVKQYSEEEWEEFRARDPKNRIQSNDNNETSKKDVIESYFARGSRALNECLKANLEEGWLTVLLIA